MVSFKKKTLWQRIRLIWSRWTNWGKALVIFSIPSMDSDDSFIKFPSVDPRTTKKPKISSKIKSFFKEDFDIAAPANSEEKSTEMRVDKVEEIKPEEKERASAKTETEKEAKVASSQKKSEGASKDAKIASTKQQKLADTSKPEKKKSKT